MLLGQMPQVSLLEKYDLTQFSGVMAAVKEGHLANLNTALETHEQVLGIGYRRKKLCKNVSKYRCRQQSHH